MTDADFTAAISAEPDDDLRRLAYADWLEENTGTVPCGRCDGSGRRPGVYMESYWRPEERIEWTEFHYGVLPAPATVLDVRPPCPACSGHGVVSDGRAERAEFIRVQVELAVPAGCDLAERSNGSCEDWNRNRPDYRVMTTCRRCLRTEHLRRRERELFDAQLPQYWSSLPDGWRVALDGSDASHFPGPNLAVVRRGFVEAVRGPLAAFWEERECDHPCHEPGVRLDYPPGCPSCGNTGRASGPTPAWRELARREPVTELTLSDRAPVAGLTWYREGHYELFHTLPESLFQIVLQDSPNNAGFGGLITQCSFSTKQRANAAVGTVLLKATRLYR